MDFLHFCLCVFLDIFRHTVFHGFLQTVDCVAAGVAHRNLGLLGISLRLLYKSLAALFGQWRNRQAYHLTVVFRSDSYLRIDDGFLNLLKH